MKDIIKYITNHFYEITDTITGIATLIFTYLTYKKGKD